MTRIERGGRGLSSLDSEGDQKTHGRGDGFSSMAHCDKG